MEYAMDAGTLSSSIKFNLLKQGSKSFIRLLK